MTKNARAIVILLTIFIVSISNLPIHLSTAQTRVEATAKQTVYSEQYLSEPEYISGETWEERITSTHFTIYYNLTGTNGVTPEYASNINQSLEYSWSKEIIQYGFSAPPNYPILVYIGYLADDYGQTNGVQYLPSGNYEVENITMGINMQDLGLLQYVCAHELFHCVQLSYANTASWFIADVNDWVIEGSAVWMGSMVYPNYEGTVSYVDYVNDFMSTPYRALTALSYEAVLYWIYLYEHNGGLETIKSIIQQNKNLNAIQAVNATLNARGTTFSQAFKEWTIANYLKDLFYTNGQKFNKIATSSVPNNGVPYSGQEETYNGFVSDWSTEYLEISSSVIYMPMQLIGEESSNIAKIFIEDGIPIISDFLLDSNFEGIFYLMQANNLDKIVIIVCSFGDETSQNLIQFTLTLLSSSYVLNGPFTASSSESTMSITDDASTQESTNYSLSVAKTSSVESSTETTILLSQKSINKLNSELNILIGDSYSTASSCEINATLAYDSTAGLSSEINTTIVRETSSRESSITNIQVLAEFNLNLDPGWNMVSFPAIPEDTNFASVFNGVGYYQVITWTGTNYVAATNVEVGRGYWVLVLEESTLNLSGTPVNSYGLDLPAGWSMIGSVHANSVSASSVFPAYYQLVTWSGTSYVTATTIEPGKGYWALVLTPTHITVG